MENKNKEQQIQEISILEQNLQNLLFQNQAFQMEISETNAALKEIQDSKEVFKIVGQLMIKSEPEKVKEELLNKEKLLSLRIKSIENQESEMSKQLESLKKKVL
ncbi:MAG: prefoldin subunit [Nanoarchaeota archaeon]|nr:prefoldin subunit [Nanoarchaeota archaeon]MBU2459324.1 prefoldin subunit [Nanoarchaeota archaeon]